MAELEDEFGDIVAKARRGLDYTADELAHLTTMTRRDIEDIEEYQLIPDTERLTALAEALSLDPRKLAIIAAGEWEPAPVDLEKLPVLVRRVMAPYGSYRENCFIIGCRNTSAAAIIDPGGVVDELLGAVDEDGLSLEMVLITHGHGDHVGGLAELVGARPGIKVFANPAETLLLKDTEPIVHADDGYEIRLGDLTVQALHTPGHTPGSTCYHTNGICLVGDTLFAGSIGRPGSHEVYERMLRSIREKVLSLPSETVILPGHGPVTTVGDELKHNPFF